MKESMSKKLLISSTLFAIGAVGYILIELLWRGKSHWSMGLAGGVCFLTFGKLWNKIKLLPKVYVALFGSLIITLTELVFGIIFNIILKKNVWDYSNLPLNFCGQICLLFSTLWGFLSLIFMPLAGKINSLFVKQ